MAQVVINNATYTQLNTVDSAYLIQNTSGSPIKIAFGATQPIPTATGFILDHQQGIGNADFIGLAWGLATSLGDGSVEVAE